MCDGIPIHHIHSAAQTFEDDDEDEYEERQLIPTVSPAPQLDKADS